MPHPNPRRAFHRCVSGDREGTYAECGRCAGMVRPWMVDGEEWREVPDALGYLASSLGRVKHASPGRKPAKPVPNKRGYGRIWTGGTRETKVRRTVHSLVAAAFHGPRPEGMVINHIDGNNQNNRPENLEYVTQKENVAHAARLGRHNANRKGLRHKRNRDSSLLRTDG